MATFGVVDEDGDWYETDGDPVERFEEMRAEVERLTGELLKAMGARDGHRRRQLEAERALMLLLIRAGGRVEFTPKEMISVPSGGSFVSSRDVATGNEVLEFRAAGSGTGDGHDVGD